MPYAKAEDRAAQRKRWADAHKESEAARKRLYAEEHRDEIRAKDNERNYRFRMWEVARVTTSVWELALHTGTALEMANPMFVFELRGQRQRETLLDPLPKW